MPSLSLTTEGNLRSEINGDPTLATEVSVVRKSIAQAGAPTFARIVSAELVVQSGADVEVARSKELLVDDVTVCCIAN